MPLAMHRFGGRHTRGVDNLAVGDAAANIDVETGVLGRGIRHSSDARPVWLDRHPDTGARITGVVIPRWRETVDRVVAIAREHPYLPYVGWDVLLTDDGFRILEGTATTTRAWGLSGGEADAGGPSDPQVLPAPGRHRVSTSRPSGSTDEIGPRTDRDGDRKIPSVATTKEELEMVDFSQNTEEPRQSSHGVPSELRLGPIETMESLPRVRCSNWSDFGLVPAS